MPFQFMQGMAKACCASPLICGNWWWAQQFLRWCPDQCVFWCPLATLLPSPSPSIPYPFITLDSIFSSPVVSWQLKARRLLGKVVCHSSSSHWGTTGKLPRKSRDSRGTVWKRNRKRSSRLSHSELNSEEKLGFKACFYFKLKFGDVSVLLWSKRLKELAERRYAMRKRCHTTLPMSSALVCLPVLSTCCAKTAIYTKLCQIIQYISTAHSSYTGRAGTNFVWDNKAMCIIYKH